MRGTKKLRVFEAFTGIGSQRMALSKLGVPHEVVAISEIDKYAIKSYEAIWNKSMNLGDISKVKIEDVPDHDLFTYSFPCTDISIAGAKLGLKEGSGTRSSLLWECKRIIESKKIKYLMLENVKNLISKKFMPDFQKWLDYLESIGYTNYWALLNAKDFGIPQNRERVFCISILGEHKPFKFPKKQELRLRLKDVLDDNVDEKFYLSDEQIRKIKHSNFNQNRARIQEKDWCDTLCARDFKDPKCVKVKPNRLFGTFDKENSKRQAGSVWDKDGLCPTLDTMQGGWRTPSVIEQKDLIMTLKNFTDTGIVLNKDYGFRVRKLTPKETWRLMGFPDEAFEKAEKVCSNSQLYKQAGNSIVVNVLEAIFKELFKEYY